MAAEREEQEQQQQQAASEAVDLPRPGGKHSHEPWRAMNYWKARPPSARRRAHGCYPVNVVDVLVLAQATKVSARKLSTQAGNKMTEVRHLPSCASV